MKKIYLWEKAPYISYSKDAFNPSITEFKVNDNKSAVIVCPGGAYMGKAGHEGAPIAETFNKNGINAFTLDYNVHPCHKFAPLSDIQRAVRVVRSLGYERVATLGFSAGGHLCATSGTLYDFDAYEKTDDIDKLSARPDAFIPCYPVITFNDPYAHAGSRWALLGDEEKDTELVELFCNEKHVTKNTPPCFLWHTADDEAVPVKNSLMMANALSENGVYFELHIYPHGCHGLGLAEGHTDVETWSSHAATFLKKLEF